MKKELVTKLQALRAASEIGCSGAHKNDDGNWMPCASMEELARLSDTAETSKWRSVVPGYSSSRTKKSDNTERTQIGRIKKRKRDWEDLGEKPIMGIESIPGPNGGLVSGNLFAGKSDTYEESPNSEETQEQSGIEKKSVGPEYVRENDKDVFMDPESARARSRQIGCIGISRRVSKTGRTVWMPCTNMSDYANRTGSTSLGRRNAENKKKRDMEKAVRTVLVDKTKKLFTRKKSIARELIESQY